MDETENQRSAEDKIADTMLSLYGPDAGVVALDVLRAECVKLATSHWARSGMEYSDSLVDEAMRRYLERRFRFVAPKAPVFAEKLGMLYIQREQWKGRAAIAVSIAAMIALVGTVPVFKQGDDRRQTLEEPISLIKKAANEARLKADSEEQRLNRIRLALPDHTPYAKTLVSKAEYTLAEIRTKANSAAGANIDGPDLEQAIIDGGRADLALFLLGRQINAIDSLTFAASELNRIIDSEAFRLHKTTPAVVALAQKAVKELSLNSEAALGVTGTVQKLQVALNDLNMITPLEQRANYIKSLFEKMNLDGKDFAIIDGLMFKMAAQKEAISLEGAKSVVSEMEETLRFASSPMAALIVDRAGFPSVIEKVSRDGSTRRWYAVAEMIDLEGKMVPFNVLSSDKKDVRQVKAFGVHIPAEEVARIQSDQQHDGHIDDRVIGTKPANKLSIVFNERFGKNPEVITDW